jgi:hypothetical protein
MAHKMQLENKRFNKILDDGSQITLYYNSSNNLYYLHSYDLNSKNSKELQNIVNMNIQKPKELWGHSVILYNALNGDMKKINNIINDIKSINRNYLNIEIERLNKDYNINLDYSIYSKLYGHNFIIYHDINFNYLDEDLKIQLTKEMKEAIINEKEQK